MQMRSVTNDTSNLAGARHTPFLDTLVTVFLISCISDAGATFLQVVKEEILLA